MQPIYIDLHIHTSEDANNLNTNYDIAELVGQIKKLNGDSPFMISLTDHNTINKSAYLKAKNLGLNLIIGVELHIQNRAEAKSYHCHIYFNAPIEEAVIDSLNEILDELYPNKLPDRNDPNTPDIQKIINSFDTFDFILLPHGSQKHGAFNYSINDGENLDNAINRSIYYNQFDGFTSRSTKGLEATHRYFERLGISEFINLVTCSDNYSPSIYPRSHSGNDDDFIPTWMFAQPTFDGLRLSFLDDITEKYSYKPRINTWNRNKNEFILFINNLNSQSTSPILISDITVNNSDIIEVNAEEVEDLDIFDIRENFDSKCREFNELMNNLSIQQNEFNDRMPKHVEQLNAVGATKNMKKIRIAIMAVANDMDDIATLYDESAPKIITIFGEIIDWGVKLQQYDLGDNNEQIKAENREALHSLVIAVLTGKNALINGRNELTKIIGIEKHQKRAQRRLTESYTKIIEAFEKCTIKANDMANA